MNPKLSRNIIASYLGSAWCALMSIVFVPMYIKFMGIESYGLVGFFASLQAFLILLDFGLSTTANREIATLSANEGQANQARDVVRTLEIIYWAVAILLGVVLALLGPALSARWVNPDKLSPQTVRQAAAILGLVIAFRWPTSLYSGVLTGMQRLVLLNWINALMATLRGAGAVIALWLVSPTIETFLTWQVVASIVQTGAMAACVWRLVWCGSLRGRFSRAIVARIWRFSAGMTGISIAVLFLTQVDKLILSKMLYLRDFGYYTLAASVSSTLLMLVSPITKAVFPKMSGLVSTQNLVDLTRLYHRSSQLVTVTTMPAAIVLSLFSYEILLLWTNDPHVARQTFLLLSLLTLGTALNAMMHIPYNLQLAWGWTSLTLGINVVSVILLVPCTIVLTLQFGAVGGAVSWVTLNAGYVLFGITLMHRRILVGEKWHWYRRDVGLPTLAALGPALSVRYLMPAELSKFEVLGVLTSSVVCSYAAALLIAPLIRGDFMNAMKTLLVFPVKKETS